MQNQDFQHLTIRELQADDYNQGYLTLLAQLTSVGEISKTAFEERLKELKDSPDYKILVWEDLVKKQVVGTATLLIERKFIHECGKVGHIEDVVVDSTYRGLKLGQRLIEALLQDAKALGCYKIILDCAESNIPFYEKSGLKKKEIQMTLVGRRVVIELRNDIIVRGRVDAVDDLMNITLTDATITPLQAAPRSASFLFLKGANIRFVHLPKGSDPAAMLAAHALQVNKARLEAVQNTLRLNERALPKGVEAPGSEAAEAGAEGQGAQPEGMEVNKAMRDDDQ